MVAWLQRISALTVVAALSVAGTLLVVQQAPASGGTLRPANEPVKDLTILTGEADRLFEVGRFAEAYDKYVAVIGSGMKDVRPMGRAAFILALLERPDTDRLANRALALDNLDAGANAALCLHALRRSEASLQIERCASASQIEPTTPAYRSLGIIALSETRQHGMAQTAFSGARHDAPNSWATFWANATLQEAAGDYDSAIDSLRSAIELQPELPSLRRSLGAVLRAHSMWQPAMKEFETAIALKQDDGRAYYGLALCFYGQRDYASAAVHLQKSTNFEPGYAPAWRILGWSEYFRHNHESAAAAFSRATSLNAMDTDSWVGLGWARFALYQDAEAQKAFVKAQTADPKSVGATEGLAALKRRGVGN